MLLTSFIAKLGASGVIVGLLSSPFTHFMDEEYEKNKNKSTRYKIVMYSFMFISVLGIFGGAALLLISALIKLWI